MSLQQKTPSKEATTPNPTVTNDPLKTDPTDALDPSDTTDFEAIDLCQYKYVLHGIDEPVFTVTGPHLFQKPDLSPETLPPNAEIVSSTLELKRPGIDKPSKCWITTGGKILFANPADEVPFTKHAANHGFIRPPAQALLAALLALLPAPLLDSDDDPNETCPSEKITAIT